MTGIEHIKSNQLHVSNTSTILLILPNPCGRQTAGVSKFSPHAEQVVIEIKWVGVPNE